MQRAGDLLALERLARGVLAAQRHQARHLVLGQLDLLAAERGERQVGDLEVVDGAGGIGGHAGAHGFSYFVDGRADGRVGLVDREAAVERRLGRRADPVQGAEPVVDGAGEVGIGAHAQLERDVGDAELVLVDQLAQPLQPLDLARAVAAMPTLACAGRRPGRPARGSAASAATSRWPRRPAESSGFSGVRVLIVGANPTTVVSDFSICERLNTNLTSTDQRSHVRTKEAADVQRPDARTRTRTCARARVPRRSTCSAPTAAAATTSRRQLDVAAVTAASQPTPARTAVAGASDRPVAPAADEHRLTRSRALARRPATRPSMHSRICGPAPTLESPRRRHRRAPTARSRAPARRTRRSPGGSRRAPAAAAAASGAEVGDPQHLGDVDVLRASARSAARCRCWP